MQTLQTKTRRLLELLEHEEIPFGVCYSDEKPDGFGPKSKQTRGETSTNASNE